MLYVQHLLGVGHLRRASLLAKALDAAGADCLFVSGGLPQDKLDIGTARLAQLPPVFCRDESFTLLDETGSPVTQDWKDRRRALLLELFRRERPEVLLIEQYPFGRRNMRFELKPLLEEAWGASPRPLVFSSIRDVLAKDFSDERLAEILSLVQRRFDGVLVHGDPAFIPFGRSFRGAEALAGKLRYTGYVVEEMTQGEALTPSGEVLVSSGGGQVGGPLMEACIGARALTALKEAPWRILAAQAFPESYMERLRQQARDASGGGILIERARPDFRQLLAACRLSISMAGYNTTLEVLQCGVPAVLMPYAAGEEGEQLLRARLLAEQGVVTLTRYHDPTPESIAASVAEALAKPRAEGPALDLGGAAASARLLLEAVHERRGAA
jgi:predicted glycosyltransferase